MRRKGLGSSLLGMIIPFLTVFVIVTVALVIFVQVSRVSNGNTVAVVSVMVITMVMLSMLVAVGDVVRRKIMVERTAQEILRATEKIAAGDFSVRLETRHVYEKYNDYDLIMENINTMAAALEKNEALNTDFISNVSHEIKTPLAVIRNYVSLLRSDVDAETRRKYIQTITQATERLSDLVSNILKLNKLENQELSIEYENINLHDMLAEAVLQFEDAYERKQIELECDFEEVELCSARGYLEIVWNNLLSNAVKFTEQGGTISVSLKKVGKTAVVCVRDTGCGISAESGAHIFDKFYQGDTSHAGEGNGLGLALVKKVIDLIGGEISVKSELGKGSAFTVTLKDYEA